MALVVYITSNIDYEQKWSYYWIGNHSSFNKLSDVALQVRAAEILIS